MEDQGNLVRVTIYGQEYTVKAPADASYIKSIAEYVDQKMREVQEELATPQVPAKVAILAAMNISDELFSVRRKNEDISDRVGQKLSSLIELVDEALEE
ncbi:MAG: cell division protein ZapA [Fidelibacterota bacterium]